MLKLSKEKTYTFPLRAGYESMSLVARTDELAVLSPSINSDLKQKLKDALEDISIMLVKMPSSQLVKSVQYLFNNKQSNISFRKDHIATPDRVNRINSHITFISNNKTVGYISADANSIALSYDLDKSNLDVKKAVYEYYHGLIRAAILTASPSNLVGLVEPIIDFYVRLFKHTLDMSSLTEYQEYILKFVVAKFVGLTLFKYNDGKSQLLAMKYISSISQESKDNLLLEIENYDSMFKSATTMKDIFSVLHGLGVIFDSSAASITKLYTSLTVNNYLSVMSSSLDIVISAIIMSNYSKDYFVLNLDSSITNKIESVSANLIKHIKYGSVPDVS